MSKNVLVLLGILDFFNFSINYLCYIMLYNIFKS